VQEAKKRQVDDLQILLGNGWAHVGVGRNDGKAAGEYSAIFYQKSVDQVTLPRHHLHVTNQIQGAPSSYSLGTLFGCQTHLSNHQR
jgi:hypothetical protein